MDHERRFSVALQSAITQHKQSFAPGRHNANRVVINVGGVRYETYKSTLKNIPDTRLSWLTETTAHNPDYDPLNGEYFFDRHPGVFNMIINYYRTGRLHVPSDVCGPLFEEELAFWGLDEKQIEPCCWSNYRAHRDAQETLADFDGENAEEDVSDDEMADETIAQRFGIIEETNSKRSSVWERWQPKIWSLLEDPKSSRGAKFRDKVVIMMADETIAQRFGIIEETNSKRSSVWERWQPKIWSLLEDPKSSRGAKFRDKVVIMMADETIAQRFGIIEETNSKRSSVWERWQPKIWSLLEDPKSSRGAKAAAIVSVVFVLFSIATFCMETHVLFRYVKVHNVTLNGITVRETQRRTRPMLFLDVMEYVCIGYFTLEIVIRFICCPAKGAHVKQALNWVDFLSVIPFYTKQIVVVIDPSLEDSPGLYFLNSLRLIRIFRILKLTRHVSGLKILAHTIKASAKELLLLILVLSIGVLIFSCLIYYAEQIQEDVKNDFTNIPRAFWWAVVTMTTLGYGDMFPRTALGYIVGAICALCGLLMLALPVPVIVNNFTLYYSHAQARLKLPKKAKNCLAGAADALKQQNSLDLGVSLEAGFSNPASTSGSCHSLKSIQSAGADRKGSNDSNADSCDSGIKTASNNEEPTGISVIFTDEIANFTTAPCQTPSVATSSKKPYSRRRSVLPGGGVSNGQVRRGSMAQRNHGQYRRRSLFPNNIVDVEI